MTGVVLPFVREANDLMAAVELWNAIAYDLGFSRVQRLTKERQQKLVARLKECGGIEGWATAMEKVRRSSFLNGSASRGRGHQNWRCNFDFILQASSFTKLMEGAYDDRVQITRSADREAILRGLGAGRMATQLRPPAGPDGGAGSGGAGEGASDNDPGRPAGLGERD